MLPASQSAHSNGTPTRMSTLSLYSSGERTSSLLERLSESERGLVLAGDGRCDSPGYCAKFDSYTFIEEDINRVVDFQLVQVSKVPLFRNGTNSFSPSFGHPLSNLAIV